MAFEGEVLFVQARLKVLHRGPPIHAAQHKALTVREAGQAGGLPPQLGQLAAGGLARAAQVEHLLRPASELQGPVWADLVGLI